MRQRVLFVLTALLGLAGIAPQHPEETAFEIGSGGRETRTHVAFETPPGIVSASIRIVVDRTAKVGLNFFALQVDFDNGTWAHGGLQDVNGPDGPQGPRVRQVNWGGLVDRGGGDADYDEADAPADLEKIQNPPTGQHVGPYAWKTGVEYEYLIERGRRVTLPPGNYSLTPGDDPVHLRRSRQMWEWRFTVRPVSAPGEPFVAVLYDAADAIDTLSVWNEAGYGSSDAEQSTRWTRPRYRVRGEDGERTPASWQRF